MLFIVLTVFWVFAMVVVIATFPTKSSIHEIEVILIGLGLWVWLATMYLSYRLNTERQKVTDILDETQEQIRDERRKITDILREIRKAQNYDFEQKPTELHPRKNKPRS